MKEKKLVCGVGINDADYVVEINKTIGYTEEGKQIKKTIWRCPFYQCWKNMLVRCYNEKHLARRPTYRGCYTYPEWRYFMIFRAWMERQDWQGKHLDKDILFPGNKMYGPETCVFVDAKVNTFLTESPNRRGQWPIGVTLDKRYNRYGATCKDINTGKSRHLGNFDTPEEAHKAWLAFKLEQAKILAGQQTDSRVAKALIDRYENYLVQT